MKTPNPRKQCGVREVFSALFVVGLILSSAVGCNFTKMPEKQSSTNVPALFAQIYYSDEPKVQKPPEDSTIHQLLRTGREPSAAASYVPSETITLDDSKFMFIEAEQPLEVQSLDALSVSGEIEWEGIRHPLSTSVAIVKKSAPEKSRIKISVSDISSVIGTGRNKLFVLHFQLKSPIGGNVTLTLPCRLPPVSVEYSLQSLSDYLRQDNELTREYSSQTVGGEELTLAQVAKITNNEDSPIKIQVGRVVAGKITQDIETRMGFSLGQFVGPRTFVGYPPNEPCNLTPHGSHIESYLWGDRLYLLPLSSSLGAEFEKTQRDESQKIVLVLRPKETVEIGLYSTDKRLRAWRVSGPLHPESGPTITICYSSLTCATQNPQKPPAIYQCDSDFRVQPKIATVASTVLSIDGVWSKSSQRETESVSSLIKASFFSDFKLTKTPPSYRIRVFKEKSELPWREGL